MMRDVGSERRRGFSAGHVLGAIVIAAGVGASVFAVLARRAVRVEAMPAAEAARRLDGVRAVFGEARPLLDGEGARRRPPSRAPGTREAERLRVLAYRARDRQWVEADVPLWFVDLKGPALQLALGGSHFDLARVGLTAAQLRELGPTLLVDEATGEAGSRLLVWID